MTFELAVENAYALVTDNPQDYSPHLGFAVLVGLLGIASAPQIWTQIPTQAKIDALRALLHDGQLTLPEVMLASLTMTVR